MVSGTHSKTRSNRLVKYKIMTTTDTEKEIRERIANVTKDYDHVLRIGPATVDINAPRALMQQSAVVMLDELYELLHEKRPRFVCDDRTKLNH